MNPSEKNTAPAPQGAVLVIEDEAPIRRFLRASLSGQNFRVIETATGREGLALAGSHAPDLVILDLGLPDMDGMDVLRQLREWSQVPVIILTARGHEREKITGLEAGADDYLTKPFSIGELIARARVALRHAHRGADGAAGAGGAGGAGGGESGRYVCGELSVEFEMRQVRLAGKEIALTPVQFKLLAALARNAGRVMTQKQLLKEVWGPGARGDKQHYVRAYIHQLRHKLESDPARPRYLITEPWIGYRLASETGFEP